MSLSPHETPAFNPRTVFITGASRGIGAHLALGLLTDGHRVVATARRLESLSDLRDAAAKLDAEDRLLTLAVDVCGQASVDAAADEAESRWGLIEVIINNAGVAGSAPLHKTPDELWAQMIDINLTGSFRVARRLHIGRHTRDQLAEYVLMCGIECRGKYRIHLHAVWIATCRGCALLHQGLGALQSLVGDKRMQVYPVESAARPAKAFLAEANEMNGDVGIQPVTHAQIRQVSHGAVMAHDFLTPPEFAEQINSLL